MTIFLGILIGLISLVFLITIHEVGHFVVAKMSGAYVYEFAIGFGPRILTIKGKETWFTIRAVPLGGFNYIASKDVDPPKGRENENVPDERMLESINRWKKTFFILFGPLVNLIIALFIFTTAITAAKAYPQDLYFYGAEYSSISEKLIDEDVKERKITYNYKQDISLVGMRVYTVNKDGSYSLDQTSLYQDKDSNSVKNDYGVKNLSYDGYKTEGVFYNKGESSPTYYKTVYAFKDQISNAKKNIKVNDGDKFHVQLFYMLRDSYSSKFLDNQIYWTNAMSEDSTYNLGDNIGIAAPTHYFKSASAAYGFAWKETFVQVWSTIKAFGNIFTFNFSNISGPIGIVTEAQNAIASPLKYFIFVGSISSSLFMFNMFIVPPLDGYRLIENFVEMALKREIKQKTKYWLYGIGICLMIALVIVSSVFDIIRL